MSTADGTVIGTTQILNNGPAANRWNLVIMGDGYQTSQLGQYATDVQQFVTSLLTTPPFDHLQHAINVFRIDVSSTDAGADDPAACGGTGATARTYFDATFCSGGIRRLLVVNTTTALNVAASRVPQFHMAMVMVNSTVYGGSGGHVAVFSRAQGADEIALHEMGHTAFRLADEYEYWAGCGIDTDRNNHPATEPAEPNVTINGNRATIKWRGLVAATTPIPTTRNANCAQCDPQASPVAAGVVGAFEGAHYYHCGAFRPAFTCRMRALNNPYCGVCGREIERTLTPFIPKLDKFDLGNTPSRPAGAKETAMSPPRSFDTPSIGRGSDDQLEVGPP
jgi:IgA Peptidase M64